MYMIKDWPGAETISQLIEKSIDKKNNGQIWYLIAYFINHQTFSG